MGRHNRSSSSPEYLKCQWKIAKTVEGGTDEGWIAVKADKESGVLLASKKHAVILGLSRTALQLSVKKHDILKALPAVVIKSTRNVSVGILPSGFGSTSEDNCTAAMPKEQKPTMITLGLWVPEQKALVIPAGVTIHEDDVPLSEFRERFKGTPLTSRQYV